MKSITATNLYKEFGDFVAVNNVNFEVNRGEIFGFLGPNGAGKSTTIRMLCGIMTPTRGTALVEGIDLAQNPDEVKANIGYMSQKFSLYQDLSVLQNIEFYAGIHGLGEKQFRKKAKEIIDLSALHGMENALTRTLSGGWKQRLALACSIIHEPKVLFLDEPTAGVDPSTRKEFWNLIYNYSSLGNTVFVTTHYMNEAEFCDRLALMYNGEIIEMGTTGELKTHFSGYTLYETQFADNTAALNQLLQFRYIEDGFHYGDCIHFITPKGYADISSLESQLSISGNPLVFLQEITPTMEDVFIVSIKKREKVS